MDTTKISKHGKLSGAWIFSAFIIIMVGTIVYLTSISRTDDLIIEVNEYGQVSDTWSTNTGDEVSFPESVHIGEDGYTSFSCILPTAIHKDDAIVYDAHYCGQRVYINGELIYSFAAEPVFPFGNTRGNARLLVPMLPEYAGQEMTIEMYNPFGTTETYFAGIFFGPAGEFKYALLYENIWRIVMAASITAVAITMLLFGISHMMTKSSQASTFTFFYFTFLAFSVATWIMSDPAVVQLFSNETAVAQYIAFLSLIGIGAFDMGLCSCLLTRKAAHFHVMEAIGYILGILLFALFVADIADPVAMMVPICIYGAVCVLASLIFCGMEFRRSHMAKILFVGQLVLLSGVATALVLLAMDPMKSNTMWPIVGSYTCYLILLFLLLMNYEQTILNRSNKTGAYWKLAYTDQLTGIANRAAMERIFDALEERRDESHEIMFFMADLNDLKKTNDTLGHEAGDVLIKAAADCFNAVFYKGCPDGKSLLSFRLGGDEFAAIVVDSEQPVEYYYQRMDEELRKKRDAGVNIGVAIGHAVCTYPTDGVNLHSGLYRAADCKMYERKLEMKNDGK